MGYLLCAFSPGNFLIELLPGLFELAVAQADLPLKIFKSFQRDLSFGAGLVDVFMFQKCRRKKNLSGVSILICVTVCKSDVSLIKGD